MSEADFLRLIEQGDDTARLAFADWLEERGDQRAAWVRDKRIFRWMLPDAGDPVPRLLGALREDRNSHDAAELLPLVAGASAVPALLELVQGGGWQAYRAAQALSKMGSAV